MKILHGETMSMSYDQKDLCSGIGALKCIRGLIHQETANKAYQGFIEP